MARRFVPDSGDIVWLEFSPQVGHEQAGHRPALVLSPTAYNNKTGTMLCCPMTTQIKGYPFEVIIHAEGISGAVLSDQV
ncbi:MAG: endoribonuclease MazF, partial [Gallionella sp.]